MEKIITYDSTESEKILILIKNHLKLHCYSLIYQITYSLTIINKKNTGMLAKETNTPKIIIFILFLSKFSIFLLIFYTYLIIFLLILF